MTAWKCGICGQRWVQTEDSKRQQHVLGCPNAREGDMIVKRDTDDKP